jgi:redox-sensitive bicupin YhaK (pirin superfamily)
MTIVLPNPDTAPEIHKLRRTSEIKRQGPFTLHMNAPGRNIPGWNDHGYGPLALIVESILEPGTWIRLHPHTNDEIISWVPGGIMRHNDTTVGELIVDKDHFMVMNSGSGFWHEERTLHSDPHLRMLQIFVRPHSADLEPKIQFGPVQAGPVNAWRHLFGPEGSQAPFFVRNAVNFYDIRLEAGAEVVTPDVPRGWQTYFYVFTGSATAGDREFGEAETGLVQASVSFAMRATEASTVVAFVLDPDARIVRLGTVGG